MAIQNIFYGVGIIFIFVSIWYFARDFIAALPKEIKLILLIASIIITFILAELCREVNK